MARLYGGHAATTVEEMYVRMHVGRYVGHCHYSTHNTGMGKSVCNDTVHTAQVCSC